MTLGAFSLLAPTGLLVCLLALLPVAVIVVASRRQRRVARSLRLGPGPARPAIIAAALAASTCSAVGIAAAQPVLTTTGDRSVRTGSQVVFVVDVSTSMSASARPGAPSRLEQARAVVAELRATVPDVPAGISGLTDRLLPYVFPTVDSGVFAETLARSVEIDAPPPQEVSSVATAFEPLALLVDAGFFSPGTEHRTCVLVTDGETRAGSASVARLAGRRGCRLLVVRVGGADDRIFRPDGSAVAGYRPEISAATAVEGLARLARGAAFTEGELSAATVALTRAAEVGARLQVGAETSSHALAPFFAGLALVGAILLSSRAVRLETRRLRLIRGRGYDPTTES